MLISFPRVEVFTDATIMQILRRRLYGTLAIPRYAESLSCLPLAQETDESPMLNMLLINKNIKELVKTGRLGEARKVFDELPQRDEISWTNIISGYLNVSATSEALSLFSRFRVDPGLQMDPFTLSLALKACGLSMNAECGESLHGFSVKTGLLNSVFVGSALVDMYSKLGKIWNGFRLFQEMPVRNVVSWTAIITGLVHSGHQKEGLLSFAEMWREGIIYDSYVLAVALKACANLGQLNNGREIHNYAIKKGLDNTTYVANSLVTMYNKCNKLDYGLRLFRTMDSRDVVSWTSWIQTYVQMGEERLGIQAFLEMSVTSVKPNSFTFATVISGCANLSKLDWGAQLHAHVFQIGLDECLSVANSLVTLYSRCGQLYYASRVFSGMKTRDIISWSTIIAGCAQSGYSDKSFEFLSWMRREGPKPTEFVLSSLLSVCGNIAILDQGKQLHAHVLSIGLDSTPMVKSSLINMYAKCGSINDASMVFYMEENNDIITWTAMINGYAEHGCSYEAINLFEELPNAGLNPDSVTFIGVLGACSQAGLVDLGFHYFNLMRKFYNISPSKEHFGCMVDLLCRAGRLNDAEDMIRTMPVEQDAVVWSILLRSSRLHGDDECGKRAAEMIIKLDPSCDGTHANLANIYASEGKWLTSAEIRKLMKSKGIIKKSGWSWG